MAEFVGITARFGNQDKREACALAMTCPAMIEEAGHRTGTPPKYITSGDAWTAQIVGPDTIVKKAYIVVDEAFPAGTTVSVDIAGTTLFTDVAVDTKGLTVSGTEDLYFENLQTISVNIVNGAAGTAITEGVLRVVLDADNPGVRTGSYAGA
jgi:ABC-type Fe3+/spermidine/putrescine transport system ATPase subunit